MNKTLPIFLCILFCLDINAQIYQPMPVSGGQWDVARCWSFYPGGWHDEYSIQLDGSDTIINGRIYKKLNLVTHHLPGTEFDSIYTTYLGAMREADRQVFFISEYLALDTVERMLYDFNVEQVGDTIFSQILTHDLLQFIPHIVTAIDSVWIDDAYHRRIHLRDENSFFTEIWIEGIGSNMGLVYASYWQLTDNSYDLICFYNETELEYVNPDPTFLFCISPLPDLQCELNTSVEAGPDENTFSVYPNPAGEYLHIKGDDLWTKADIATSAGQIINCRNQTDQLEIGQLAPGLYFLRIYGGRNEVLATIRFVKL